MSICFPLPIFAAHVQLTIRPCREGSFAAVRRAKHVITGVDVAVKIFVKAAIVDDYVK